MTGSIVESSDFRRNETRVSDDDDDEDDRIDGTNGTLSIARFVESVRWL
jgi:hypothetical protein